MVTGGTRSTSTPILKFLIKNALFEPASDALHIEHWANADVEHNNKATIPAMAGSTALSFERLFIKVPLPTPADVL